MLSAENAPPRARACCPSRCCADDLVACATYYQPGRNLAVLGGDFFDVVETPDGRVRAVIGDVMGHGPDEAALGVHLRVAWRTLVLAGVPDETILTSLSRLLSAESGSGGRFVTACDITIEPDCGAERCGWPDTRRRWSARRAGPAYLDPEVGPPLGHRGTHRCERGAGPTPAAGRSRARCCRPGASLILYTDGLLDAYRVPANGSSLGVDELLEATSEAVAPGERDRVVDPGDRRQRAGALARRHRGRRADRARRPADR